MFEKIKANNKLRYLVLSGIFVIGFIGTYFVLKVSKIFDKEAFLLQTENLYTATTPEPIEESSGIFNILLLGQGGAGHDGGGLTDSIIVAHIDTNNKKYALISIPRDLWVSGNHKINAEASVNGFASLGSAVQNITSLKIDNYIVIDFANFVAMIDDLDGVNVEVPSSFTDSYYPIKGMENDACGFTENEINAFKSQYSGFNLEKQFTCRYETVSYQKGPAVLDGEAALKYVRSRHADGDFARSARQFSVLFGIMDKLASSKSLGKIDSTIDSLSKMVKTDLTLGKIKTLMEIFGDTSLYKGTEIHLTTENVFNEGTSSQGGYILYPKAGSLNFSEVKNYITNNF